MKQSTKKVLRNIARYVFMFTKSILLYCPKQTASMSQPVLHNKNACRFCIKSYYLQKNRQKNV